MTTLRILLELADDKCIEAIEAQPHIRPAGSHVNARGCAQAEHNYTSPRTAIRRRNVVPSNPALTPIRRPPDSSTNKAVCRACGAAGRSTTSTGISDTAGSVLLLRSNEPRHASIRFEYLFSEDSDNPCCRQYSVRFSSLRSNDATSSATSARLRRRRLGCSDWDDVLFMHPVNHEIYACESMAFPEGILESNRQSNMIIANHLMLLLNNDPDSVIEFFRKNSALADHEISFYAVGLAFLKKGLLPEAEEHLRLSDLLEPDPMTKAYLAETLYRRGRCAEALETCRDATLLIEQYELRSAADLDGEARDPGHYPYQLKKGLRSALLAVEGKSLISIG